MSVLENFTKRMSETARIAAKKSTELVEVTKLNMSIGTEEDKIQKVYTEMGKMAFDLYTNGESLGEDFRERCEIIKVYEENIKELRQRILELKRVKICPECKVELELDIAYCPKCGTKQDFYEPKLETKDKTCISCGGINSLSSSFCSKCGTKLE